MSKKGKAPTINNIKELNLEIDYDKLANAIVKAQEKSQGKNDKHSKIRIFMMNYVNGSLYIGLAILLVYIIYNMWSSTDLSIASDVIRSAAFSLYFGIVAVIMFLSQRESLDDTSEETKFHFNTNVSLVALIIAILALYHEIV